MTGVQHLTIGGDEAEQRLDRWMRRRFPALTQGRIEKMCRKGEVRVDGTRASASTRVAPGQVVRVPPLAPGERAADAGPAPTRAPEAPSAADAEMLRRAVIHRDDALIVLNKPPGLAVQGGTKQRRHLDAMLSALCFGHDGSPRLVHRLDKDTSGLLVLARTGAAAAAMTKAFRGRDVEKTYVALVAGRPEPRAGTVRYGLVKAGAKGAGEKMRVVHPDEVAATPGAKPALTDYRVIEAAGRRASWVALRPLTGRTHQLRAHMAALGCPIAGDGKYAETADERPGGGRGADLGQGLSRKLHLHAARLGFAHPVTGRRMAFAAPLPEHMARSWAVFGWDFSEMPDPVFER